MFIWIYTWMHVLVSVFLWVVIAMWISVYASVLILGHRYVYMCTSTVCMCCFCIFRALTRIPFDIRIKCYRLTLWHFILLAELVEISELYMCLSFYLCYPCLMLVCIYLWVVKLCLHRYPLYFPYPHTAVIAYAANLVTVIYWSLPFLPTL